MVYIQATRDNQWNLIWPDGQVQKFATLSFASGFCSKMGANAVVLDIYGNRFN